MHAYTRPSPPPKLEPYSPNQSLLFGTLSNSFTPTPRTSPPRFTPFAIPRTEERRTETPAPAEYSRQSSISSVGTAIIDATSEAKRRRRAVLNGRKILCYGRFRGGRGHLGRLATVLELCLLGYPGLCSGRDGLRIDGLGLIVNRPGVRPCFQKQAVSTQRPATTRDCGGERISNASCGYWKGWECCGG